MIRNQRQKYVGWYHPYTIIPICSNLKILKFSLASDLVLATTPRCYGYEALTKSPPSALSCDIAFAALLFQYYIQTRTLTPTLTLTINGVFAYMCALCQLLLMGSHVINGVFFLDLPSFGYVTKQQQLFLAITPRG